MNPSERRRQVRHQLEEQLVEMGYARARLWHVLDFCDDPTANAALITALVEVCRHEHELLVFVEPQVTR